MNFYLVIVSFQSEKKIIGVNYDKSFSSTKLTLEPQVCLLTKSLH